MARILKLDVNDTADVLVVQEVKKRTWWTLIMADNWCSNGMGLQRQLSSRQPGLDLPIDEGIFQSLCGSEIPNSLPKTKLGLWAHNMTLVAILGPIHDLNWKLVDGKLAESDSDQLVNDITGRLDAWLASLPEEMRLTDENLDSYARRGSGGTFVALHLGYHHYATLLYFQYLDVRRSRTTAKELYHTRCKSHASNYSRLLAQSRSKANCEAVYATVGHMTVVSSSVLLHMLLFGREEELEEARQNLTSNFAALIELRQLWPSLERVVCRIA